MIEASSGLSLCNSEVTIIEANDGASGVAGI